MTGLHVAEYGELGMLAWGDVSGCAGPGSPLVYITSGGFGAICEWDAIGFPPVGLHHPVPTRDNEAKTLSTALWTVQFPHATLNSDADHTFNIVSEPDHGPKGMGRFTSLTHVTWGSRTLYVI